MANHEYYSVSVHSMLEMFWSKCKVFGALRFTLYATDCAVNRRFSFISTLIYRMPSLQQLIEFS